MYVMWFHAWKNINFYALAAAAACRGNNKKSRVKSMWEPYCSQMNLLKKHFLNCQIHRKKTFFLLKIKSPKKILFHDFFFGNEFSTIRLRFFMSQCLQKKSRWSSVFIFARICEDGKSWLTLWSLRICYDVEWNLWSRKFWSCYFLLTLGCSVMFGLSFVKYFELGESNYCWGSNLLNHMELWVHVEDSEM